MPPSEACLLLMVRFGSNIDDTEAHYIKVMCDEIFGRENFVDTIIWEKAHFLQFSPQFSMDHDYIFVYSKPPSGFRGDCHELRNLIQFIQIQIMIPEALGFLAIPTQTSRIHKGSTNWMGRPAVGSPLRRAHTGGFPREVKFENWIKMAVSGGDPSGMRARASSVTSEVSNSVPRMLWSKNEVGSNRTSKNEMRALFPNR